MFTNEDMKQFKDCTEEEQLEIFKAFWEGRTQFWNECFEEWQENTILNPVKIYRVIRPKEENSEGATPIKGIPWEVIDSKWNWATMDEVGYLYLFEEMPTMDTVCHCWVSNNPFCNIDDIFKIDLSEVNWNTSLTKRPDHC